MNDDNGFRENKGHFVNGNVFRDIHGGSHNLKLWKGFTKSNDFGGRFFVSVRRGGRWMPFSSADTLSDALRSGKGYTWNTAGASFKVSATSMSGREELSRVQSIGNPYYKSRSEQNVFIEKPSYRIKSGGEKREITFKGIESQRNKRRKLLI